MELYDYQKTWVKKIIDYYKNTPEIFHPKANLFLDMGLGKTITALYIAKELSPKRLLIVCPKSLISMWEYELSRVFHISYTRYEDLDMLVSENIMTAVCIKNYEQFLSIKSVSNFDLVILDEAHKIKNCSSKTHKCISKYVKTTRTLCLTGTPITRDLMDLFGILTCTGPQIWNGLTAAQFKARYITNGGAGRIYELMQLISPYTIFGKITDFIDMPEWEDIVIPVHPDVSQLIQLDGVYASDKKALERICEAQQITGSVEYASPKRNDCEQLISDILDNGEKVVLFVKYTKEYEYFINKYKDICAGINGSVKDRFDKVQEFENNPKIKIFVGNLQTASLGITLIKAHKCIFYSETHNWGDMDQAKRRIYRTGQNHFCTYYYLIAQGTVDQIIHKSNLNKTDLIEDFINFYGGIK